MNESWKPVVGLEDRYEVSDLGRIRSLRYNFGYRLVPLVMSPWQARTGHRLVTLVRDGVRVKKVQVGRPVLQAVVGESPKMACSHLNHDASDNRLSNLIWESRLDNERRKSRDGRRPCGEASSRAKLTADQVIEIRGDLLKGLFQRQIAKKFGISRSTIQAIGSRKLWAHLEEK